MKGISVIIFVVISSAHLLAQNQPIQIKPQSSGNKITFLADNNSFFPYTVTIDFPVFENMRSNVALPTVVTIPARAKQLTILEIFKKPNASSWKYNVRYQFERGDALHAFHDSTIVYLLPYQSNRKHVLMQGYFGSFSHATVHALDFEMPEGTSLIAARDGVVVELKEDFAEGGMDPTFKDKGNYVLILHNDGSWAGYFHVQKDGVLVEVGQKVIRGERIALSGNTGWSSAPHVHFEVSLPTQKGRITVPTKFETANSKPTFLEEGKSY
jgi:murein DD-endopeptidase MepM/ murein hydrolase activator NlpD